MDSQRLLEKLHDLNKVLQRLEEGLSIEDVTDIVMDGIIQRFEFTYELAWKVLKLFLEFQGIAEAKTPRAVFIEAYSLGYLQNGDEWIDMLNDRHLTSHTYDEERARNILQKIQLKHFGNLKSLYKTIFQELTKEENVDL